MIYITKGQANTVVLTLNERATTTSHDWLFEFVNDTTGEIIAFTAFEMSTNTDRYNMFTITESNTQNLYNGTIKLEAGFWSYTVFEMASTSPVSLVKANALATVETGKVWVRNSSANPITTFVGDSNTKSSKTFKG
ncbi:MAG: hypothetical protein PX635_00700 [Nostocales cyanobacterium LE14-WE12]|jgi:hypothetical protein|nr:hypothetical protein [Nostocales cyanobacterium LE14-WE12]